MNLAYLTTHPVQYVAPLLRAISAERDMSFKVYFMSRHSIGQFFDPLYKQVISWDVPLTEGYDHEFLPTLINPKRLGFLAPYPVGLLTRLRRDKIDALWVHGWTKPFLFFSIISAALIGVRIYLRDEAHHYSRPRGWLKSILRRLLFKIMDQFIAGYLAIGKANRDHYLSMGIRADRIFMMPYAVDNDYFAEMLSPIPNRADFGLGNDLAVFLYAGRLAAEKRPGDILLALGHLPEISRKKLKVIFAGDGPMREALEQQAAQFKLETCVSFAGFQSQSALRNWYFLADALLLPSSREPWGLVVNEAMNQGCAIIASDQVGSGPDLIEPGINGAIFRVGDSHQLAKILGALTDNRQLLANMGAASLERIKTYDFAADIRGLRAALGLPS